jgi:nitrogen regulatory protein PII
MMQMIEAVIRPNKLDAVKAALASVGILGVSAMEIRGFGKQLGHTERYRGGRTDVGFVPKVMIRLCIKAEDKEKAVKAITESARTGGMTGAGAVGDGKIFVYPVAEVVRIRTGETNEAAI